jgi:tungstate transport system substrate-binding protein
VQQINRVIRIVSLLFSLVVMSSAHADDLSMTLAVTKSTQLSGLLNYILPIFQTAANLKVQVILVDPGQEVAVAERGDVDAMLFDDRPAEDKIVAKGYGINRLDAMYDDYVIVGPSSDPAGIHGFNDTRKAFAQIAAKRALFASRGDDSSTNRLELRLWKSADVKLGKKATWYRGVGQGMAATLALAAAKNAYTLTDRATWAGLKNRQNLEILAEGDPAWSNIYGTILANPAKRPLEKFTYARIWHDWLTNHHGREAFTSYKINGEQIFFPPRQTAP